MGRTSSTSAGAVSLIRVPTNTDAELHPLGEGLRVRTAPGQRSATVQRRVDGGLLGTGVGAKWIDLPVAAEWSTRGPNRQRVIAIDRQGLEQVIGHDAADAALGGNGIAMARPPSRSDDEEDEWGDEPQQEKAKSRDRRQKSPPPATDLEQRPDRPAAKRPHELSDEEIADIAHQIVSGHASDKHRIDRDEFPELGSDPELEAHVAEVIKHKDYKDLPKGRTAYWGRDNKTVVVVDPLAEDKGTVLRPVNGKRYFDNLPTRYQ